MSLQNPIQHGVPRNDAISYHKKDTSVKFPEYLSSRLSPSKEGCDYGIVCAN